MNTPNVYVLQKPSTSISQSSKYIIDCNNKLEKSNYTTKDWFEIKDILKETNYNENNKIILGILEKKKQCVAKIGETETLEKEYKISKIINNFNVIKTFCFFKCYDDYKLINKQSKYLCKKNGNKMSVLLMEYCSLGNMREYDFYKHQTEFYSSVKQSILCMIELCYNVGFYHQDTHAGNFLLKRTKKELIVYNIDGVEYEIETNGLKVVIMDFENSSLIEKPKSDFFVKDFLIRDINRFINDLGMNSKKITYNVNKNITSLNINKIIQEIDKIKIEKYKSLEELMEERLKLYE